MNHQARSGHVRLSVALNAIVMYVLELARMRFRSGSGFVWQIDDNFLHNSYLGILGSNFVHLKLILDSVF